MDLRILEFGILLRVGGWWESRFGVGCMGNGERVELKFFESFVVRKGKS